MAARPGREFIGISNGRFGLHPEIYTTGKPVGITHPVGANVRMACLGMDARDQQPLTLARFKFSHGSEEPIGLACENDNGIFGVPGRSLGRNWRGYRGNKRCKASRKNSNQDREGASDQFQQLNFLSTQVALSLGCNLGLSCGPFAWANSVNLAFPLDPSKTLYDGPNLQ